MPTYEVNFYLMNIRGEKKTVEPTMSFSGDFADEQSAISAFSSDFETAYPHKTYMSEAIAAS
jgi:hypothetical protein